MPHKVHFNNISDLNIKTVHSNTSPIQEILDQKNNSNNNHPFLKINALNQKMTINQCLSKLQLRTKNKTITETPY
jgi:hypothetical protein